MAEKHKREKVRQPHPSGIRVSEGTSQAIGFPARFPLLLASQSEAGHHPRTSQGLTVANTWLPSGAPMVPSGAPITVRPSSGSPSQEPHLLMLAH